MKRFIAFLLFLGLTGCASIEGTRDKSLTLKRNQLTTNITSIAILPIKENAVQAGLSTKIESSLYFSLLSNFQGVNIIGSVKGDGGNLCNFSLPDGATSYKSYQRPLGVTASLGGYSVPWELHLGVTLGGYTNTKIPIHDFTDYKPESAEEWAPGSDLAILLLLHEKTSVRN